jgi:hypothetical protein
MCVGGDKVAELVAREREQARERERVQRLWLNKKTFQKKGKMRLSASVFVRLY